MAELTDPRTIALLDDHVLVVDGLSYWIRTHAPDFTVVATVASWEGLIAHPSFPADVVAMARTLDSSPSLEERIRACVEAGSKVIVMSTETGADVEADTLAAGAHSFIPKSRPAEAVMDAARAMLNMQRGDSVVTQTGDPEQSNQTDLDPWHRRVLRLYSQGESTVDIALIEGVRFERVRAALKVIREQYEAQGRHVDTRDELLRRAAEDGFLSQPD